MAEQSSEQSVQIASLAGGCFWCIESAFNSIKGVLTATSGYMGGQSENPNYQEVCTGTTGHAETVQLHFDSEIISYQEILAIFFTLHNPTQLNRQGNDIGTHYRSEIFTHSAAQHDIAVKVIALINQDNRFEQAIVTQVSAAVRFYCGEDYHQAYVKNNPANQYCQVVIAPKLAKFRQSFHKKLK